MVVKAEALSYEKADSFILRLMQKGNLGPGDRFLPEREIARQLHVSQVSVRRAMEKYVERGVLEKIQGRGTFVKKASAATGRIAVLHTHSRPGIYNSSFYTDILSGMESQAMVADRSLQLMSLLHATKSPEQIVHELAGEVEGFILLDPNPALAPDLQVIMEKNGMPVVCANSMDATSFADGVITDNLNDISQVMAYLKDMGHTRIGFAAHLNHAAQKLLPNIRARLAAYRYFLDESGFEYRPDFVLSFGYRREPGNTMADPESLFNYLNTDEDIRAFGALMDSENPPTAMVCSSDEEAFYLYKLAHKKGTAIPEQLSIVGYDDLEEASVVRPLLTTIRTDIREIGRLALERLQMKIQEKNNGSMKHHNITLPGILVKRDSVRDLSKQKECV